MNHTHHAVITGGHLSPAISTIEELHRDSWRITYFGRRYYSSDQQQLETDEYKIITEQNISFINITSGKLHRYSILAALLSLTQVPLGIVQSLWHLLKSRPCVVVSFGGYLSVPVVIAAWLCRIPVITHEQTRTPGLANRINARFAKIVAVSFTDNLSQFPKSKVILTGNPIRTQALHTITDLPGIEKCNPSLPTIYITGGNQGSRTINELILNILPQLVARYNIIHSLGIHPDQQQLFEKAQASTTSSSAGTYIPLRYISPEHIGSVFASATAVVSRAGANTCTELAQLQKPSILIPLMSGQHNEQLANAEQLKQLGLAEIILQPDLSPEALLKHLDTVTRNKSRYHADPTAINTLFPLDAAHKLAQLTSQLCKSV